VVAGVYYIKCRVSGKLYIGSSLDIRGRLKSHRGMLGRGQHHSRRLQRAWDKYGGENFEFGVLEVCAIGRLRSREVWWMNYHDSYFNGYNGTTWAGQGTTIPEQVKARMRESARKVGENPELRRKRSENARRQHEMGRLGRRCWKPESEKGISSKLKAAWVRRKGPPPEVVVLPRQRLLFTD
jgi:group I intron endonuclease